MMRSKAGWLLIALYLICGPGALPARNSSEVTRREAVVKSLLVPGWGQSTLGADAIARGFMIAEAGLWISYYMASETAQWYQQTYRGFAALHAGSDYALKPDVYYFWLGQYDSIQEYNAAQVRSRDLDSIYPTASNYDWAWDDPANRQRYNRLRRASLLAAKGASFIMGSMVLNRVVSVVNILFLTRSGDGLATRTPQLSTRWVSIPDGGELRFVLIF